MIKLIIAYAVISIALVATGVFSVMVYNSIITITTEDCYHETFHGDIKSSSLLPVSTNKPISVDHEQFW